MKVTEDEEREKRLGVLSLYMNFVHCQLNDSKITLV